MVYVKGDVVGVAGARRRTPFPFLIPLAFVLLARLVDGRMRRIKSLSFCVWVSA